MSVTYPQVTVELTAINGNAFAILGVVRSAMGRAGVSDENIAAFVTEATSGDYDHLLQTCMTTVNIT